MNGGLIEKTNGQWDYSKLMKREGEIFGDTDRRSSFDISISANKLNCSSEKLEGKKVILKKWNSKKQREITIPIDVLEYLCYGVLDYVKEQGNVFNRSYILPDEEFSIIFHLKEKKYTDEIINAFKALATFGGLGAKSRNGFGSFAIKHESEKSISIRNLKNGELKPFTCFSSKTEVLRTRGTYSRQNWRGVLSELAETYKKSRESIEPKHDYHKRKYLGSPLIADKIIHSFLERHAKSFFLSIRETGDDKLTGTILFLPYLFLEDSQYFQNHHQNQYDKVSYEFFNLLAQRLNKI